jgi:chromosome segregation ATPase
MKYAFYFWLGIILTLVCTCVSSKSGADTAVLDYQRQVTQLEDRNQELERRIDQYDSTVGRSIQQLKDIRERARGMEGTIDDIIKLFDEYQQRVDELSRAYNSITHTTEDSN